MSELVDFVLARIDDDEAFARSLVSPDAVVPEEQRERFAEWSRRELADCEAKRRIVATSGGPDTPRPDGA